MDFLPNIILSITFVINLVCWRDIVKKGAEDPASLKVYAEAGVQRVAYSGQKSTSKNSAVSAASTVKPFCVFQEFLQYRIVFIFPGHVHHMAALAEGMDLCAGIKVLQCRPL